MPTPITGTVRISGPVSPFNVEDTYPATDPQYGLGGLRTVGTTTDMEAIPASRRQVGMMVYVSGATAFYSLVGTTANSGWTTSFQMGAGANILPLNNTFTGVNTFSGGLCAAGGITFNGTVRGRTATFGGLQFKSFGNTGGEISPSNSQIPRINIRMPSENSSIIQTIASEWSLGNQTENGIDVQYETTLSGNATTGNVVVESNKFIVNAPGGISLGTSLTPSPVSIVSTLTGSTASFSGLLTASAGISASSGVFGTLQSNSGATFSANVYVGATLSVNGNLIVNGTTTTINSTTISVDDKNIELGSVDTPSDATANGGGISLKGATDKTIVWSNTTSGTTLAAAWNFNQDINLTKSGNPGYYINGTVVIDGASLGPNIVNSNLTKVGTIATGVWQGTIIGGTYGGTGLSSYVKGDILYAAASGSVLSKLAISTTSGQLIQTDGSNLSWGDLLIADGSGNGVSTLTSGKYRIQDASTSVKGLSRYDSFNFSVISGLVDIAAIDGGSYT